MKCGLSSLGGFLFALLLLTAPARPGIGAPITVYFDGPVVDGQHRGLDDESLPGGVPVIGADVFAVTGSLDVVEQSADGSIVLSGSAPNQVTSQWVVENLYGAFPDQVYLLFSRTLNVDEPFPTTYNVDFTDEGDEAHDRAGLVIDPATGWVVVEDTQSVDRYYVGIPLDFDAAGADCGGVTLLVGQACVDVTYFLEDPQNQVFENGMEDVLVLPQLGILMAVVPEPGTGLLVSLGLVGLAARRRLG